MYHVSAQGVDKRIVNVHYYYTRVSGCLCLCTACMRLEWSLRTRFCALYILLSSLNDRLWRGCPTRRPELATYCMPSFSLTEHVYKRVKLAERQFDGTRVQKSEIGRASV